MCYRLNRHISLLAKNKKYPKCRKFSTAEVMESIFNEDGKTSFAVNNFFATKVLFSSMYILSYRKRFPITNEK